MIRKSWRTQLWEKDKEEQLSPTTDRISFFMKHATEYKVNHS